MQRGTRWVKFLSSHRQKKYRILRHAYWGVLPEGVQPVVGMTVKTGGPKKSHKRRKGVKPKGFELDGSERIVEKFLAPINAPLPPALYAVGLNYKKHAREVKKEMPRNPVASPLGAIQWTALFWALVSEPGLLDFQISRLLIFEIFCFAKYVWTIWW